MFEKCSCLSDKTLPPVPPNNSVFITVSLSLVSALLFQLKYNFPLIPHDMTGNIPFVSLLLVSSSYNKHSRLFSAQFRSVNLRCCWTTEQEWAASMSWFFWLCFVEYSRDIPGLGCPAWPVVESLLCLLYCATWCYQDLGTYLACSKAEI